MLDPRRDIDQECGHPRDPIDVTVYRDLIARDPIAKRVNELYPLESWRVQPEVYEVESEDCDTAFEESLDNFPKTLGGDCDWFEDGESNSLWELAKRADIEVGKGQYGVIFWGLGDTDDWSQEVNWACKPPVLYARPLPEYMAQISAFESDRKSRRYGEPKSYSITTYDPTDPYSSSGIGVPMQAFNVHWSRVTHIPSDVTTNPVFGVPRLQPVLNRILDLKKLYGGSAEMYWKGAFPGISIETQPQMGDVPIDKSAMRDMMEHYFEGLQRYLALAGLTAKTLAPVVSDPTSQIKAHLEAICIALGVPMRIFLGSERGELSSAQDTMEWADRIRARQRYYVSYRIIRPMINFLIRVGALCPPKQYRIHWPDISSPSDMERAQYATAVVGALGQLAAGADSHIAPVDFWTRLLGKTNEEAEAIVCSAQQHAADTQVQDMELERQMIDEGLKADPTDPEQNPMLAQQNGFAKAFAEK